MASSSSIIRKLSRNKTLIITTLNNNSRILTSPTHLPDPPIPLFFNTPKPNPNKFPVFYPSFAFESFLNPVNQTGYIQQEDNDVVSEENVIYADSVKKKRKKKMNKHKLKKLRKRLRRKT
ncbi:hypothetical protein Tco_1093494 [Tanacetum coccineum]|uniref:Small ribosomal subunit protein mS38 n=1 Tax=Tanacetum coccineum TaxID=301880 RepID=A0ABQ5IE22_9ASTR